MALLTIALAGIATGGVLYKQLNNKKVLKRKKSIKERIQDLAPISAHKKALAIMADNTTSGLTSEEEQKKKQESRKTLAIFSGSTALSIAGVYAPTLALLSLPGALYLLRNVYTNTAKNIFKGKFTGVDSFVAFFSTSIILLGHFFILHFYISLYLLNRFLVGKVKNESQKNIIDIFRDQPNSAWSIVDGVEVEVPTSSLEKDALIIVRAGESIPVDGIVTEGAATVDQHKLTGESQPVEKQVGDSVFACTVVLTGFIYVQVEKTGEATTSARISSILNNTVNFKTKKQLWAEKFTEQTTVPTLGLSAAGLILAGPTVALTVINSHFRYRLTLATSVSALTYLNLAAQQGILLKSALILEKLKDIDTVIFDKTGTLTTEIPHVTNITTFNNWTTDAVLSLAATAEARQSHPIAKAICNKAEELALPIEQIDDVNYQIGFGLTAHIQNQKVQIGSLRYAEQLGLEIPKSLHEKAEQCHHIGNSLIVLSVDNKIAGAIELQASIRPEAATVIKNLSDLGVSLHVISGDHPAPTKQLSETLGIRNYHAEILPEAKADIIKQLQSEGHSVCYIGDGINDAIALSEAEVSVSMRGASSVATDTADVILMEQDLYHLYELFQLAAEYEQNVKSTSRMVLIPSLMNLGLAFVPGYGLAASMSLSAASVLASFGSSILPLVRHQQPSIETDTQIDDEKIIDSEKLQ